MLGKLVTVPPPPPLEQAAVDSYYPLPMEPSEVTADASDYSTAAV